MPDDVQLPQDYILRKMDEYGQKMVQATLAGDVQGTLDYAIELAELLEAAGGDNAPAVIQNKVHDIMNQPIPKVSPKAEKELMGEEAKPPAPNDVNPPTTTQEKLTPEEPQVYIPTKPKELRGFLTDAEKHYVYVPDERMIRQMSSTLSGSGPDSHLSIYLEYKDKNGTHTWTPTKPWTCDIPYPIDVLRVFQGSEEKPDFKSIATWRIIGIRFEGKTSCKGDKVLMSDGTWKNIEDVEIGDKVISPSLEGKPSTIESVISKHNRFEPEVYDVLDKLTGERLYSCSWNHEIPISRYYSRRLTKDGRKRGYERMTFIYSAKHVAELVNSNNVVHSFTTPMITFDRENSSIDPYSLGVWLGDGSCGSSTNHSGRITQVNITNSNDVVMAEFNKAYPDEILTRYKKLNTETYNWSITSKGKFAAELTRLGLAGKDSGTKFIPVECKLSSAAYRIELLSGLFDTDGYVSARGQLVYTTKSKALANDVADVVFSLGGRARIRKNKKSIKSIDFTGEYYFVHIAFTKPILHLRTWKMKRLKGLSRRTANHITISLKRAAPQQVYGIEISGRTKLYVTNKWMVTHNSALAEAIATRYLQNGASIYDLYAANDNESLAWLESPFADRVVLVHGDETTLIFEGKRKFNTMPISELDPSTAPYGRIYIVGKRFFANEELYYSALERLTGKFNEKDEWDMTNVIIIREAQEWIAGRMKSGKPRNARDSAEEFTSFHNALFHHGSAVIIDSQRDVGVTKDVRELTSWLCYDKETEVLTLKGWKKFEDLDDEDRVGTLTSAGYLTYQTPIAKQKFDYNGKMLRFGGKGCGYDLLVTPDHGMYLQKYNSTERIFVDAKDVVGRIEQRHQSTLDFRIIRSLDWLGVEEETFVLPAQTRTGHNWTKPMVYPSMNIKMDEWLDFFGFWLAEGSTSATNGAVRIYQKDPSVITHYKHLMENWGLKTTMCAYKTVDGSMCYLQIADKRLYGVLHPIGNSHTKFIPLEIKRLSSRQLRILLDAYYLGDGSHATNGTDTKLAASVSERLAGDMQEIILKCGYTTTGGFEEPKTRMLHGRKMKGTSRIYHFSISENNKTPAIMLNHVTEEDYVGPVYDVTVPNHTLVIRRNMKICISGNCMKAMGNMDIPRKITWTMRYVQPAVLRLMPKHLFGFIGEKGQFAIWWFMLPPWHLTRGKSIIKRLGIRASVDEEQVRRIMESMRAEEGRGGRKTVDKATHEAIIEDHIGEEQGGTVDDPKGKPLSTIAEEMDLNYGTVKLQWKKHKMGTCECSLLEEGE